MTNLFPFHINQKFWNKLLLLYINRWFCNESYFPSVQVYILTNNTTDRHKRSNFHSRGGVLRSEYQMILWLIPWPHIWELPVLRYHSIRVIYQHPFWGVIFLVILHDFIRQNYHKNLSYRYPLPLIMVNYPIFPINYHNLYFQMYFQYLFFLQKYPNNVSKKCKIL